MTLHIKTHFILCSGCGSENMSVHWFGFQGEMEKEEEKEEEDEEVGWGGRFLTRGRDFPTGTCIHITL